MRRPFNTTCDLWTGPGCLFVTPNVLYAPEIPCRFVPSNEIQGLDPWALDCAGWVTFDATNPFLYEYTTDGVSNLTIDFSAGTQIAIPSGFPPTMYVLRWEQVFPLGGTFYFRASVGFLPYIIF